MWKETIFYLTVQVILVNNKFTSMSSQQNFQWLFIQEDIKVLELLTSFIDTPFQKRSAKLMGKNFSF